MIEASFQLGVTQPDPDGIARATFTSSDESLSLQVHFNPQTLRLQVTNNVAQRGNSDRTKQFASQSSATLSMQLLFDTTDSGADVRAHTQQLMQMMRPPEQAGREQQQIRFAWGTYRFDGVFTSYSETIDYFSPEGVPLRASVDLTMSEQDRTPTDAASGDAGAAGGDDVFEIEAGIGISARAAIGGDALSARAVAALNGEASVRRLSGAPLEISAEVQLRGPAVFASAGVSAGAGIGADFGAGLGLDVGGGAQLGFGASRGLDLGASFNANASLGFDSSAGFGVSASPAGSTAVRVELGMSAEPARVQGPTWGARASAGVSASAGAFAGLARAPINLPATRLDPRRLRAARPETRLRADPQSAFEIGGRAIDAQASGMLADVGTHASLSHRIRFDQE